MAESKSLAAQSAGFQMPGALMAPSAPIVSGLEWAPYISFAHPSRKDEWAKLQAKFGSVKEGHPYFIDGTDMRQLPTMKLGYICGTQYWSHKSPNGTLLAFSRTAKPTPFREHVEAVVLVYLDDKVVPANVSFHTTKCGAAKTMDENLRLAATIEWGQQGPDYGMTMQIPQAFLRFYADVALGEPRNSKTTGLPYQPLYASIKPTTSTEWAAVGQSTEDIQKQLELAAKRYQYVLDELATKEVA